MDTTVYDGSSQAFTIGYDGDSLPILESKGEIVALLRQDMNEPNMRLLRDAPALLAEVRRLQAENARLRIPSIRRGRS